MKIELFRESKAPVEIENYEKYQADWVRFYDAVEAKYIKDPQKKDYDKAQALLNYGELRLTKKYNGKVEIDFPETVEALDELCERFRVPIMFAQKADGSGLVAIVMDSYGG